MNFLVGLFHFAAPLLAIVMVVLGCWALSQWLRRQGFGVWLDRLANGLDRGKAWIRRLVIPASTIVTNIGRGVGRLPVFGSKQNAQLWNNLDSLARQNPKR